MVIHRYDVSPGNIISNQSRSTYTIKNNIRESCFNQKCHLFPSFSTRFILLDHFFEKLTREGGNYVHE